MAGGFTFLFCHALLLSTTFSFLWGENESVNNQLDGGVYIKIDIKSPAPIYEVVGSTEAYYYTVYSDNVTVCGDAKPQRAKEDYRITFLVSKITDKDVGERCYCYTSDSRCICCYHIGTRSEEAEERIRLNPYISTLRYTTDKFLTVKYAGQEDVSVSLRSKTKPAVLHPHQSLDVELEATGYPLYTLALICENRTIHRNMSLKWEYSLNYSAIFPLGQTKAVIHCVAVAGYGDQSTRSIPLRISTAILTSTPEPKKVTDSPYIWLTIPFSLVLLLGIALCVLMFRRRLPWLTAVQNKFCITAETSIPQSSLTPNHDANGDTQEDHGKTQFAYDNQVAIPLQECTQSGGVEHQGIPGNVSTKYDISSKLDRSIGNIYNQVDPNNGEPTINCEQDQLLHSPPNIHLPPQNVAQNMAVSSIGATGSHIENPLYSITNPEADAATFTDDNSTYSEQKLMDLPPMPAKGAHTTQQPKEGYASGGPTNLSVDSTSPPKPNSSPHGKQGNSPAINVHNYYFAAQVNANTVTNNWTDAQEQPRLLDESSNPQPAADQTPNLPKHGFPPSWNFQGTSKETSDPARNLHRTAGETADSTWNPDRTAGETADSAWNVDIKAGETADSLWNSHRTAGETADSTWDSHRTADETADLQQHKNRTYGATAGSSYDQIDYNDSLWSSLPEEIYLPACVLEPVENTELPSGPCESDWIDEEH